MNHNVAKACSMTWARMGLKKWLISCSAPLCDRYGQSVRFCYFVFQKNAKIHYLVLQNLLACCPEMQVIHYFINNLLN